MPRRCVTLNHDPAATTHPDGVEGEERHRVQSSHVPAVVATLRRFVRWIPLRSPNDGGATADGALETNTLVDASAENPDAPDATTRADAVAQDTAVLDTAPATDGGPDRSDGCDSQQAAAPTFSPEPGASTCAPLAVTLATTTPHASIFYTTDATNPTPTSTVYQGPLEIGETTQLRAVASAPCMLDSEVASATYTITIPGDVPSPPEPTPEPGTYPHDLTVSLVELTAGAIVCYTLDGSRPVCPCPETGVCPDGSTEYEADAGIAISGSVTGASTGQMTLNAVACAPGSSQGGASPPLVYTLGLDPVAFAPAAGTTVPASGTLSGVHITESGASTDQPYASICWSSDGTSVPDCACAGATPENAAALVGPGLYVSAGNATPVMQVQQAQGASGITVRAVGCAAGYAPSDAPCATITWK